MNFFQAQPGTTHTAGIRLPRWLGIDIRLDWSWFVVGFLCLLQFTAYLQEQKIGGGVALLGGALAAGLFLATVLLHELGHAAMARRYGIRTHSIVLHVIGGVARLEREARRPGEEVAIAGAGPLVNLVLAAGLGLVALVIPKDAPMAFRALDLVVSWAAGANLVLGLLNLLPAFPLDGGRILRGFLWQHSGTRSEGTLRTAKVSRVIVALLIAVAILGLAGGSAFLAFTLGLLAFILHQATRAEEMQARQTSGFQGRPLFGRGFGNGHFRQPPPEAPRRGKVIKTIRYPDGRVIEVLED